jgi:hypothetical protein
MAREGYFFARETDSLPPFIILIFGRRFFGVASKWNFA